MGSSQSVALSDPKSWAPTTILDCPLDDSAPTSALQQYQCTTSTSVRTALTTIHLLIFLLVAVVTVFMYVVQMRVCRRRAATSLHRLPPGGGGASLLPGRGGRSKLPSSPGGDGGVARVHLAVEGAIGLLLGARPPGLRPEVGVEAAAASDAAAKAAIISACEGLAAGVCSAAGGDVWLHSNRAARIVAAAGLDTALFASLLSVDVAARRLRPLAMDAEEVAAVVVAAGELREALGVRVGVGVGGAATPSTPGPPPTGEEERKVDE